MGVENGSFPHKEVVDRYDNSRWDIFRINGGWAVVTHCGRAMFAAYPELARVMHQYKEEVRQPWRNQRTRRFLRAGGNSDVYTLGGLPLVIKEASNAQSIWSALDRMDYLHGICIEHLPEHIRVPEHFGAVFSTALRKQYLIIRKIDQGLTVEDVREGRGNVDSQTKELVLEEFAHAKDALAGAIEVYKPPESPQNLLPDYHAGNVLVDFSTPTDLVPFTLWVIDQ